VPFVVTQSLVGVTVGCEGREDVDEVDRVAEKD
jgi:hypothetical protein